MQVKSFDEAKLSEPLARAVRELGYTEPTAIQAQALPILLGGPTDFIGLAATGTGKTAAFGLPLLETIEPAHRAVQGLILCPTRELAMQVSGQINLFAKYKGTRALPVYGGASFTEQLDGLKRGAQIVVGTPGRVIDHLTRHSLSLKDVRTVVLDEADEMISMGFKEDLEKILQSTSREKSHIWLFSATMSGEVRRVADTYLRKPRHVQVNKKEMLSTTVEQLFFSVRESDKPEILCKIIETAEDFYGLVFCQTKKLVMDVTEFMAGRGYKVDCLHGDKTQMDRDRAMRAFRDKKVNLLICTDVASRGLDVKEITHVINYSLPHELDLYVHRIGRTARSGKAGVAISLVTPKNRPVIGRIEHLTKSRIKEGRIPTRKEVGAKKVSRLLGSFLEQKRYQLAMDLLGPDWKLAIKEMRPEEIVGRFLAVLSPEVFDDREKEKPFHPPHAPRAEPHQAHGQPPKKKAFWKQGHGGTHPKHKPHHKSHRP